MVKALLENFHFISFQFYWVIDGNIWKQYLSLSPTPCAVCVKDEIPALNPPVSPQVSERSVGVRSLSPRTHIHECVFVCVSWHQCLRECEIDPGHRELSELFAPGETEWPPTYQPASLCGFSWQENPLFSFCLTQYARRSLTSPHHCSGWLLLEKLVCVNCF